MPSVLDKFHDLKEKADEKGFITFFKGAKNYNLVSFDTETNGLVPKRYSPGMKLPSVLSLSAWKVKIVGKDSYIVLDKYNRFYFPTEEYNPDAIKVNGLTKEAVIEKRKGFDYPEHFSDDLNAFSEFCVDTDLFVGHNAVTFDCVLVPCIDWPKKKVYDTKSENEGVVPTDWMDNGYYTPKWRWPNLSEAVEFYKIPVEESQLHGSLYDSKMTLEVFMKMLKRSTIRLRRFDES